MVTENQVSGRGSNNKKFFLLRIAIVALLSWIIFTRVFVPARVHTDVMEPTIKKFSWVWISPLLYAVRDPKAGDIVGIRLAGSSVLHMARIIAEPGDTVSVSMGQIYVNDVPIEKGKLQMEEVDIGDFYKPTLVEAGDYFVLGDNRTMNLSVLHGEGAFGKVSHSKILGRVLR